MGGEGLDWVTSEDFPDLNSMVPMLGREGGGGWDFVTLKGFPKLNSMVLQQGWVGLDDRGELLHPTDSMGGDWWGWVTLEVSSTSTLWFYGGNGLGVGSVTSEASSNPLTPMDGGGCPRRDSPRCARGRGSSGQQLSGPAPRGRPSGRVCCCSG